MRAEWGVKKLGELYEITSSKRVFRSEWKNAGIPFYRAREIVKLAKQGFVANELFISEEMYENYSSKYGIPKEGDIMVTGVGTLGICYVVKKKDKFYFKDGNIIWLKRNSSINSRYIEYAFKSDYLRSQINDSMGATVGTYTIIKAKNTNVSVPSASEQQRIVKILDEVFEKIEKAKANAEKNLQNARGLFESYLQSIFNKFESKFLKKKLGEVCNIIGGGTPSKTNLKFYSGEIPWATVRDMKYDLIERTQYQITKDAVKSSSTNIIPKNNVLIATRVGLGKTCLIKKDTAINQDLKAIIPKNNVKLSVYYLYWWLKSISQLIIKNGTGATVHGVKLPFIKNLEIPFPEIHKQKDIVIQLNALANEIEKLEVIYRQKVSDLEEFKKSILQKAFSGELKIEESKVESFNWLNLNQILGAFIQNITHKPRGEMVLAKYIYILQEVFKAPIGLNFTKGNFGPYNIAIKKVLSNKKNAFFKKIDAGSRKVYALNTNAKKLFNNQDEELSKVNSIIEDLIKVIGDWTSEKIELLATTCKIIQDTQAVNIKVILTEMKDWKVEKRASYKNKADIFDDQSIIEILEWVKLYGWDLKLLSKA